MPVFQIKLALSLPFLFLASVVASPIFGTPNSAEAARRNAACSSGYAGGIQVVDAQSGTSHGYVSPQVSSHGNGILVSSLTTALFAAISCDSTGPADLIGIDSSTPSYPYLSAVGPYGSTSNNIGPGSAHYLMLGSSAATSPNGFPEPAPSVFPSNQNLVESAIWHVGTNYELLPQWVNSDGSLPTTYIFYWPEYQLIGFTGNYSAYPGSASNGTSNPWYEVRLLLV